jgi:hypothetical protein
MKITQTVLNQVGNELLITVDKIPTGNVGDRVHFETGKSAEITKIDNQVITVWLPPGFIWTDDCKVGSTIGIKETSRKTEPKENNIRSITITIDFK